MEYEYIEKRENGTISDYKEEWSAEEVLDLESRVHNVVEIEIVDFLKDAEVTEEIGEAAEHFRRIQGDNLHPSHRYSLGKIAEEAGIYE